MNDIGQTLLADLKAARQRAIEGFSAALTQITRHIETLEQDMTEAHAAADTAFEIRLAQFRGEFEAPPAKPAIAAPTQTSGDTGNSDAGS